MPVEKKIFKLRYRDAGKIVDRFRRIETASAKECEILPEPAGFFCWGA